MQNDNKRYHGIAKNILKNVHAYELPLRVKITNKLMRDMKAPHYCNSYKDHF